MAARVWNQVPGSIFWGTLPTPNASTAAPISPHKDKGKSLGHIQRQKNMSLKFYDFAEGVQDEKEMQQWIRENPNRGAIRVYQPGSTYSELIKCDTESTAEEVMSRCVTNDLYVYFGGQSLEPLGYESKPLSIQNEFLKSLGYSNFQRIQFEGTREDLVFMFKFVAGKEENKADERVQLTCTVKVKEFGAFSFWSKRFCVLCGCQLHIFSSSKPKGKPSLTIDLAGSNVMEYETKKHLYCLQITTIKKTIYLSFESRYEQSIWLKRAAKVVTKHPLEANLSRCSLNQLPKYLFLNKNLAALNLSHNFMLEMVEAPRLLKAEGWINDIQRFSSLKVLSLSDNNLIHFPVSVCNIVTLTELDLSCNKIKVVPQDIQKLRSLITLLLHSNLISNLPYNLHNLYQLSTLVIAFNKFKTIPHIVKELESLRILIAAGNSITLIPEDINRIQTLQILDIRLNKITPDLPSTFPELTILFSLNIRGNLITELDLKKTKNLHVINCSDNAIKTLSMHKGKLGSLNARNNRIAKLSIQTAPLNLTSLDLSKNELTLLPESLAQLVNLEKLVLNHNKLSSLPKNLLRTPQRLALLHVSNNYIIRLPIIGETCSLESLDVHSNKLSELPTNIFTNCLKLHQLNVSNNPITDIPDTQLSSKLTELRASNCSLTAKCFKKIINLRKLKLLHLAYNSIKTLPTDIITLPELEYLNIAGNQISSIQSPPYSCPRMVCMIMHSNNLTKFPDFPSMPAVETLDLACNDLKKMPQLKLFRRLKMLDLSHNKNIEIQLKDLENFRYLQYFGLLGIETDVQSVRKALGDCVDIDETSQTHDLWSFGSAHIRGTNISKTGDICMTHITVPAMNDNSGLFGVVDGGKAPDASLRIKKKLPSIVNAEIAASAQRTNNSSYAKSPLLYLEHSFLTMHRKLGDIGLKFGASMVVVHLCRKSNGEVTANIGNVGLGEAILCCRGQVTPLVSPHSPSTNKDEIYRVVKEKGFISEDDRINGICGVSRLVGCYYLHPQVIPLPTTQSISLPSNSNYIIIASHGLWKYLSYKEIGKMSKSSYHPANFARKLADQAIGCGCPLDVSVLVIKLDFPKDSTLNRESNGYQSNRQSGASGIAFEDEIIYESDDLDEEDEEGGDENYTTNIDDIMEEAFQNDEPINIKDDSCLNSEALRSISPDQLDALVLGSSPEVTDLPIVNDSASERDSLILQGSHTQLDETVEESNMPSDNIENLSALPLPTNGIDNRRVSVISSENQSFTLEDDTPLEVLEEIPQIPLEDISRTFPMRAAKLKKINFPVENSFEQTQSIQAVCSDQADIDEDDVELTQEQLEIKRRFSAPNVDLLVMNEAIAKLGGDSVEKISSSHSVRSKPSRQRSFVQASYSKLSRHSVSNSSLPGIN